MTLVIPDAGRDVEAALHERFAAERIRPDGEWFRRSDRLVDFIESSRSAPGSVFGGVKAPSPWPRVVSAIVVFVACASGLGALGAEPWLIISLSVGAAIGVLIQLPAAFGLGFWGGLTGSRWLIGAVLLSTRRRRR